MSPRCAWELAGKTDPGCVRANNEDNLFIDEGLGLLVVADGMGGHNSGEVASDLAISTIRDYAQKMLGGDKVIVPEGGDPGVSVRCRQLEHFIQTANTMIFEKGRAFPKDAGMGTTVVAVLADEKSLSVAHVGDSRLYLFRSGVLTQLTADHSLVGDQLRRGLISADAAAHSTLQNILTRAVGAEETVKVDVADHPVLPGDALILATDGLDKMVTDEQISQVIARGEPAAKVVETLVDMSRQAGATDNVTVICARLLPLPPQGLWGTILRLFQR